MLMSLRTIRPSPAEAVMPNVRGLTHTETVSLVGEIQVGGMGHNGKVIDAIKVVGSADDSRRAGHDGAVCQCCVVAATTRIAEDRPIGFIEFPVGDQARRDVRNLQHGQRRWRRACRGAKSFWTVTMYTPASARVSSSRSDGSYRSWAKARHHAAIRR